MEATYTQARAHLSTLCDHVVESCEEVIIHRRGAQDVALISAAELRSLQATAHELRSPKNAERLLRALTRARARETEPQAVAELRQELSLDPK
jgi:antitoxin YefM